MFLISKLGSILLALFIMFVFTSCDLFSHKDPEPKTEIEKLPAHTTSGKNTFGCIVNGKAHVNTNSSRMVAIYQGGFLQFGSSVTLDGVEQNINFVLLDPLETGKSYPFSSSDYRAQYVNIVNGQDCRYEYEDTYSGSLTLTSIDRTKYIISGIFDFSTSTSTCETVVITDGRFDLQYIP